MGVKRTLFAWDFTCFPVKVLSGRFLVPKVKKFFTFLLIYIPKFALRSCIFRNIVV